MILRFFIYNMVLLYALFDEKILFDIFKSEQEKKILLLGTLLWQACYHQSFDFLD